MDAFRCWRVDKYLHFTSTVSIIGLDSQTQDDLGWQIRGNWSPGYQFKPRLGPDWSLGPMCWDFIALELLFWITLGSGIQSNYAGNHWLGVQKAEHLFQNLSWEPDQKCSTHSGFYCTSIKMSINLVISANFNHNPTKRQVSWKGVLDGFSSWCTPTTSIYCFSKV